MMNTAALTLEDQIAAAFRDDAKSNDVADLITETEAALLRSNEAAEQYRMRAA
jgi:hypothetical protein